MKSILMGLGAALAFGACDSDTSTPHDGALVITTAFESPVQTGQNRLAITVDDENGQPVTDATVTVDPQMPVHGHGSSETPIVTANGDGTYSAFPVTFQMPGPWVVHVRVVHASHDQTVDLDVTVP